jgi:hypothetical protein
MNTAIAAPRPGSVVRPIAANSGVAIPSPIGNAPAIAKVHPVNRMA